MPHVAYVSHDLMMASQAQAVVAAAGGEWTLVSTLDQLDACTSASPDLVCVDLSPPGDVGERVRRVRQRWPDCPLIAFGPHVLADRLAAARDAGCDIVMSRGQFHRRMAELLGEA